MLFTLRLLKVFGFNSYCVKQNIAKYILASQLQMKNKNTRAKECRRGVCTCWVFSYYKLQVFHSHQWFRRRCCATIISQMEWRKFCVLNTHYPNLKVKYTYTGYGGRSMRFFCARADSISNLFMLRVRYDLTQLNYRYVFNLYKVVQYTCHYLVATRDGNVANGYKNYSLYYVLLTNLV